MRQPSCGPVAPSPFRLRQVGPQESRLGPVPALGKVWYLSSKLEPIEIGRGKIMYAETLYYNVKWVLQPFRFFMARFQVDEFQARACAVGGHGGAGGNGAGWGGRGDCVRDGA